jgi:hypothetical protein
MKSKFLLFALFIFTDLITSEVKAQQKAVLINAAVNSYNLYQISNQPLNEDLKAGTGFNLGFGYEQPLFKKTSLVLGFDISQRNYHDDSIKWLKNAFRHNYLSIPVNLNYYFFKNFAIQAGIQYDHLIFKQKVVFYKDNTEQESAFTKFDIGINSGLRFQFYNFELNSSINYGLIKIYDLSGTDPMTGIVIRNFAKSYMYKFGVSYLFK